LQLLFPPLLILQLSQQPSLTLSSSQVRFSSSTQGLLSSEELFMQSLGTHQIQAKSASGLVSHSTFQFGVVLASFCLLELLETDTCSSLS